MKRKISIGCDHGATALKDALVKSLGNDFEITDEGTFGTESVDYPDFAKKVCDSVKDGKADFGILLCTTGIGMSIAANKVRGIRAALCHNEDCAKFSRLHNNANVICMGTKYVPAELAAKMVKIFAETEFEGGRHQRRVGKFMDFEKD